MLKLRLQGPPGEVEAFARAIERTGAVLERSEPYRNRGASRYVRACLDVELRGSREGDAAPGTCEAEEREGLTCPQMQDRRLPGRAS